MNKKIFYLLILLMFFSYSAYGNIVIKNKTISFENFNDQWIIEPIIFTGDGILYIDIAIGFEDDLFISYYDRNLNSLNVVFIKQDNIIIDVVDNEGFVGEYSSIIVDSNNCLHVSYFDHTNSDLKYAYYNGVEWNIQVVDSFGDVGLCTCIDVDSFNYPHISYYDLSNGNLKYAYWDGFEWTIQVVEDNGDVGFGTSLVIDSDDTVHIGFTDDDKHFLYYAKKVDSNWDITLVDDDCTVFGSTSIDVDSNNFAHISYFDIRTSSEDWYLKHAYFDGINWIDEIVDPDLKYFWNDWGVSIAIDDFDRVHIGYYCWYNWDLKYAYKNNDKWSIETVDSDGDLGLYASIVVNSENYPIISYMSRSNLELKYAIKIQYSPDSPNAPTGQSMGKTDENYSFKATGFDFDSDKVKYGWDWGDQTVIEWTDFFKSGDTIEIQHSWSEKASYYVKVKVVDINGYESCWSEPLEITIPKYKMNYQVNYTCLKACAF